ncbi:hypothetical protein ACFVMC_00480 [Nocardia sp. NPDC127579]|uniref:hypothetical protein n=1 Tax=Nocardia sp. NPDC127579 TaxID=3345402 RepID=UPI00363C41EB
MSDANEYLLPPPAGVSKGDLNWEEQRRQTIEAMELGKEFMASNQPAPQQDPDPPTAPPGPSPTHHFSVRKTRTDT